MLVLTRRPREKIILTHNDGQQIVVQVISVAGDKVRLGIVALPEVTIHREEVMERIAAGEAWPAVHDVGGEGGGA